MWSMLEVLEVHSEVEAAVRMVIATEDNSALVQNFSLVDVGLDSLRAVRLLRSLKGHERHVIW